MGSRFGGSKLRILASGLLGLALVSGAASSIFAQHSSSTNKAASSQIIKGGAGHVAASGVVDMSKAQPVTATRSTPRTSATDRALKTPAQLKAYQQYVVSHAGSLPKGTSAGAPGLSKNMYGGGASPALLQKAASITSTTAGGWYPPDQAVGTVGGLTIVGVNDEWLGYASNFSVKYGPFTAEQLFAPVKLSGDTFSDPQITWNTSRARWLISWLEISHTGNGKDYLDIAVSTGTVPSPVTNWKVYRIDPGVANADDFCDYDTMGYDYWGMYVTCVTFSISQGGHIGNNTFAFPISGMLAGSFSYNYWYSIPTNLSCGTNCYYPAYRLSPATEDGGYPQAEWVAATDAGYTGVSSNLTLCSITHTIGIGTSSGPVYTCTFTALPLGYDDPIGAAQPGTATGVYPGVGFKQFALRAGRLEFAIPMAINCSGNVHDGIAWYAVAPQLTTLGVHNPQWSNGLVSNYSEAGYYCYSGADAYMPTLISSTEGEMTLVFNYSNSTVYPSIVWTGRAPTDAPGTMQQGGSGTYVVGGIHSNGSGRWGDYSACALDYGYFARGTVICAGEFGGTTASATGSGWDTEVYKIRMI